MLPTLFAPSGANTLVKLLFGLDVIGIERNAIGRAHRDALRLVGAGGSSLRNYVGSDGLAGNFQNNFLVYGRAGEPCQRCGTPIRGLRQGQRSTFCCPGCQRR